MSFSIPNNTPQSIINHLKYGDWRKTADPKRFKRAQNIVKPSIFEGWYADINKQNLIIVTEVVGIDWYELTVKIDTQGNFQGHCSCPDNHWCKHLYATLLFACELCPVEPVMESMPALHNHSTNSVSEINSWINSLKSAASQGSEEQEEALNSRFRILYCIGKNHNGQIKLSIKKAHFLKSETYTIQDVSIRNVVNSYVLPNYVTQTDYELISEVLLATPSFSNDVSIHADHRKFSSILDQAMATNRVVYQESDFDKQKKLPLVTGPVRELKLTWKSSNDSHLIPAINCDQQITRILGSNLEHYLDLPNNLIGKLNCQHPPAIIEAWIKGPPLAPEKVSQITTEISQIETMEAIPDLPSPPEQQLLSNLKPTPKLSLHRIDATPPGYLFINSKINHILVAQISFIYGEYDAHSIAAFDEKARFSFQQDGTLITVERDRVIEKLLLTQLNPLALQAAKDIFATSEIHSDFHHAQLYSEVESLNAQQWINTIASQIPLLEEQGWIIDKAEDIGFKIIDDYEFFETMEETSRDWFSFDLGIDYKGQKISLIPALAQAISADLFKHLERDLAANPDLLIPIPIDNEQSYIQFPAQRLKLIIDKLQDLFHHIKPDGSIEVPTIRAAILSDDLQLKNTSETLANLRELGKKLNHISERKLTSIPKNLKATLRDYQSDGFQWLQFLAQHQLNGILADDMGLGKTIQTLAHILAEKNSRRNKKLPSLVIAPTSVIPNWKAEAAKFTPSLKVLVLHGADRQENFEQIAQYDLVVTSYALLQRDAEIHTQQAYHIAILDEAQHIKNHKTKTTQVANTLDANHRICLSGTPMENHLGELWSLMNFLMPGLLHTHQTFTKEFRTPIEKMGDTEIQQSLNKRVAPLILRRLKEHVAKELPPKTIIPHYITLNEEQRDLYETIRAAMDERVRDAIKEQGLSKSHIIILDALLKLRQICCHPQLLKLKAAQKIHSSAKLDYLTELLATLIEEDRSVLIFSQFTTMLGIIEKHLIKEKIPFVKITGNTKDRETPVNEFQAGKVPVFLISLKAGGSGLNLTAADTVIHYDPWWNPAVENQATDRAYRIGQKKPVFVHKLICQGSIEEHIQKLQEEKAKLVESLLSTTSKKFQMDSNILENLLAPLEGMTD